jgi:hypothetical protein
MALVDTIRKAVAVADKIVKSTEETVTFEAWVGQNALGKPTYAESVPVKAIVEHKRHKRRLSEGVFVDVKTKLTILEPIADTAPLSLLAPRDNPVDPRDRFTTPNGTTGPIVDTDGMQDAGLGRPLLLQVFLGGSSGVSGTR